MRARADRRAATLRTALGAAIVVALAGCELSEVTIAESERSVVAEAYVRLHVLRQDLFGQTPLPVPAPALSVLLHETLGPSGTSAAVPGARITITRPANGQVIPFGEDALGDCVITIPVEGKGTCYTPAVPGVAYEDMREGERLSLRVELPGGGVLTSETIIPGRFELLNVRDATQCTLAPRTGTGIVWSRSAGAWGYVAETFVNGLSQTFGEQVSDPLFLWGFSASAQDTTIVFPREFGVFARGELDRDVAVGLQVGLPDSTNALVTVGAIDRNWLNWARGGNFNPSGQVRVPSVRGDGTGVFGSSVMRSFRVLSRSRPSTLPACPPDVPGVGG
jgi:hypothetical protein